MSPKEICFPIFSQGDGEVLGIDITAQDHVLYVENKINAWDYNDNGLANKAYAERGIMRFMLLQQIKSILFAGMGFSTLYNALEERRGKEFRDEQRRKSIFLQAWSGLGSSVRLREFVRLHEKYLGGKIDENNKWQWVLLTDKKEITDKNTISNTLVSAKVPQITPATSPCPSVCIASGSSAELSQVDTAALEDLEEGIEKMTGGDKKMEGILIERPAAQVKQGNLILYTTSLKVSDLLREDFYSISQLDPAHQNKGFQRLLNEGRAKKLAKYILNAWEAEDAFLPTSIFIATSKKIPYDPKTNTIKITGEVCPFNVVDGQHRVEGLRMAAQQDERVLDFEIPVNIAENLDYLAQMSHFLIVNTTQKSVDKAVEQRIYQRLTKAIAMENLPTLPAWIQKIVHKGDDDKALLYVDHLATSKDCPWFGKINMANDNSKKGTINQQSFVQAIKNYVLVAHNEVSAAAKEKELDIFKNYWIAIQNVIEAGENSVLFKYNGVFLFCMFSVPFLNLLLTKKDFKVQTMEQLLRKTFSLVDGEFSGIGHPEYWEPGGTAGSFNSGALRKINKALIDALYEADMEHGEELLI